MPVDQVRGRALTKRSEGGREWLGGPGSELLDDDDDDDDDAISAYTLKGLVRRQICWMYC